MIETLRFPRLLLDSLRIDLRRPHKIALERVAFLYARPVPNSKNGTWAAVTFWPVPEDGYEAGSGAATINTRAIKGALTEARRLQAAAFHVHEHDWVGQAIGSPTDRKTWAELMPCFSGAVDYPHGGLVLTHSDIRATQWLRGKKQPSDIKLISIVGFPMEKFYAR